MQIIINQDLSASIDLDHETMVDHVVRCLKVRLAAVGVAGWFVASHAQIHTPRATGNPIIDVVT